MREEEKFEKYWDTAKKKFEEIMFYPLERAQCKENNDKYLEYVLGYCKKDYQQAYKKIN